MYIVRVIKSRRMRWAGHVARMGEERGAYRVCFSCSPPDLNLVVTNFIFCIHVK